MNTAYCTALTEDNKADKDPVCNLVFVDDDAFFCRIIGRESDKASITYRSFERAAEALQFLQSHRSLNVMTDYRMPAMTGLEFLAQARTRQPQARLYLISAGPLPDSADEELRDLGGLLVLKDQLIKSGCLARLCEA